MVSRETGYSEDIVKEVISNFYKTLRIHFTQKLSNVIIMKEFMKFYNLRELKELTNEKEEEGLNG